MTTTARATTSGRASFSSIKNIGKSVGLLVLLVSGFAQADPPPGRLYAPSTLYYGMIDYRGLGGERSIFYDGYNWALYSTVAHICSTLLPYTNTDWGYLITLSLDVPIQEGLGGQNGCKSSTPLPNGTFPGQSVDGYFYRCPVLYTADPSFDPTDPHACYYDPPPPQIDPDTNSGDPNDGPPPSDSPPPLLSPPPVSDPLTASGAGGSNGGSSSGSGAGGVKDGCDSGVVGDPINSATGNKFDTVLDYASGGVSPLRMQRYYDSKMPALGSMGSNWRHEYDRAIEVSGNPVSSVKARRQDGKAFAFTLTNGQWKPRADITLRLQVLTDASGQNQGWRLSTSRDDIETYDTQGRLITITMRGGMTQSLTYGVDGKLVVVTDSLGHQLRFGYDPQGRVDTLTDSAGNPYRYTYDAAGNLSSRTTPDNRILSYLYENSSFPHALTGVVDGNGIRIDNTRYDTQGRAVYNERAAGGNATSISYADGSSSVMDAYGTTRNFSFQLVLGVMRSAGLTRSCPTCGNTARSTTHDANGNVSSRTDFNGIRTTYAYDLSRNLETSRTEAVGSPVERTITTEWHSDFSLPVRITEPGRITEMTYDSNRNMTSLSVTDVATSEKRTWQYEYGSYGLLLSKTLPSGEKITYAYDASGNATTSTTATGLVTSYDNYDANGRVGRITYASGRTMAFTYDVAGRLINKVETVVSPDTSTMFDWWRRLLDFIASLFGGGSSSFPAVHGANGSAITHYSYDNAGLLSDVALPDGGALHYEYDATYRLILQRDSLGNTANLIRDPMGNLVETWISDGSGTIVQKMRTTYDALGRAQQALGNNGQSLTRSFDDEGYLLSQVDALGRRSSRNHDALYRTTTVTDADNQSTLFGFSSLDQLTSVTDARGNTTSYTPNAFGEVVQEQSPDRGATQRVYENGHLMSETDARGVTHSFTYDADGRMTTSKAGSTTTTYSYDEGDLGKGRLTGLTDNSGATRYRYNSQGRVAEKVSLLRNGPELRTRYAYTLGGQLKEMATPGRHLVQYAYDIQGRPSAVMVDGKPLLDNIRFSASGIAGWTWANGAVRDEIRDLDGRTSRITSGNALVRQYSLDIINRVIGISDTQSQLNESYGYDTKDHLVSQQSASIRNTYGYDAIGNRQQRQSLKSSQLATTSYQYAANSNQLLSETTGTKTRNYAYLPSGQISNDGKYSYAYDLDGRLSQVSGTGVNVSSTYNALGQRVKKSGIGIMYFQYDEAGHLIGEYVSGGIMVREYIWLGNRLVGMLSWQEPNALLQVHTDHLGTPRAISNGSTVLWRWEGEAFGDSTPNESVAGPFRRLTMPLRFPGQYYDNETGLNYNYFRDYNPSNGRYVESDPVGLAGGINSYAYVGGNPISGFDPLGLANGPAIKPLLHPHPLDCPSSITPLEAGAGILAVGGLAIGVTEVAAAGALGRAALLAGSLVTTSAEEGVVVLEPAIDVVDQLEVLQDIKAGAELNPLGKSLYPSLFRPIK